MQTVLLTTYCFAISGWPRSNHRTFQQWLWDNHLLVASPNGSGTLNMSVHLFHKTDKLFFFRSDLGGYDSTVIPSFSIRNRFTTAKNMFSLHVAKGPISADGRSVSPRAKAARGAEHLSVELLVPIRLVAVNDSYWLCLAMVAHVPNQWYAPRGYA